MSVFARETVYAAEDKDGNEVIKHGFVLRYSPVFNIEQTNGIDLPKPVKVETVEAEEYLWKSQSKTNDPIWW